ncbi:hypothetical protein D3C73_1364060 [compost metagenome]
MYQPLFDAALGQVIDEVVERLGLAQAQRRLDVVFRILFQHLVTGPVGDIAVADMPGVQLILGEVVGMARLHAVIDRIQVLLNRRDRFGQG